MAAVAGNRVDGLAEALGAKHLREARSWSARLDDGAVERLAAKKVRGWQQRVAEAALSCEALEIECRDAEGALLGVVKVPPAEEKPKVKAAPSEREERVSEVAAIVDLVLRGQQALVQQHQTSQEAVLRATLQVMGAMAGRVEGLEKAMLRMVEMRERQVDVAAEALAEEAAAIDAEAAAHAATKAEESAREDGDVKMVERIIETQVVPAVLPMLMGKMGGFAPPEGGAAS